MNDIAEQLIRAKEASGYSYSELAKLTGIPKSNLQRFFTGDTEKIPFDYIIPLCIVLGLDATKLLGWDQPALVSATGEPPTDLTDEEKLLVLKYREAPKIIQEAIMRMLS